MMMKIECYVKNNAKNCIIFITKQLFIFLMIFDKDIQDLYSSHHCKLQEKLIFIHKNLNKMFNILTHVKMF